MKPEQPGIDRRRFLRTCGMGATALVLSGMPCSCRGVRRRPNFLFLLVDDLGWSDLSCFGNTFHETPNVDRLAASGMRFTSAYAACAVCSPTRASILTGKYPVRLGITDWIPGERHKKKPLVTRFTKTEMPLGEKTVAEALREQGYRTAFLGKWHLGAPGYYPKDQGFEVNVAGNRKGHPHDGYFSPWNLENLDDGPEGEYLTDRLTDETLALLDRYDKDREAPFLLYLSYYTVHTPIQSRRSAKKLYDEKKAQAPDPHWKNSAYAGMVHALDESVGRILDRLEATGLDEETVVFFMSDNGGVDYAGVTSNHPLRAGKGRYYEGGIREPMIVRWPGVTKPGSVCDTPVISMDFYPTMLDIARLPAEPDQHLDGLSLVPLLKGQVRLDRDTLCWHYPHYHGSGATPCSAIRAGDFKLIRYYADGRRELFDLRKDQGEKNDLAAALPEKADELEARLDRWLMEVDGYVPVPREAAPTGEVQR